ncbi:hypothetical protein CDEST_15314 [Colletotrichum destructivum]|uniref:Uncharacterized protein n=1 Tax=Colletotrichum destructivum TaxID=34406 RepID=A0AAX4J4G3_9PEZI|nr:hypothetical protein CDEST_15314 [Colletotrichum destructivum]
MAFWRLQNPGGDKPQQTTTLLNGSTSDSFSAITRYSDLDAHNTYAGLGKCGLTYSDRKPTRLLRILSGPHVQLVDSNRLEEQTGANDELGAIEARTVQAAKTLRATLESRYQLFEYETFPVMVRNKLVVVGPRLAWLKIDERCRIGNNWLTVSPTPLPKLISHPLLVLCDWTLQEEFRAQAWAPRSKILLGLACSSLSCAQASFKKTDAVVPVMLMTGERQKGREELAAVQGVIVADSKERMKARWTPYEATAFCKLGEDFLSTAKRSCGSI